MELEQALKNIDNAEDEIVDIMSKMISIPALSPVVGGEGESKRAEFLLPFLSKFDEVKRYDFEEPAYPGVKRSSLVAIKKGKKPGTIWIVSHIDTVPPGDLDLWNTDPFKVTIKDGRLYGRGTEDDGQAVVASIIAFEQFIEEEFNGKSLGIMFLADEEFGGENGLNEIIASGLFKKGLDIFLVPDSADEDKVTIHRMEKSLVWVMVKMIGKSAHGSEPRSGLNPIPDGLELHKEIIGLEKKYNKTNFDFKDERCTFTPTRMEVADGGTNAIPDYFYFAIDCRFIPECDHREFMKDVTDIVEKFKKKTKCKVELEFRSVDAGGESSMDTDLYRALAESIEEAIGKKAHSGGPNGGTCSSALRRIGFDAYCWVMYTGTEHTPNEYITIDDVKKDAEVFARIIYKLCVQ